MVQKRGKATTHSGIELGDVFTSLKKKTIAQFHDVGLVHCRDLLASVQDSVVEGEVSYSVKQLNDSK